MRAKAVVFTAPGTVEVTDVTCPDPGDDDVVVSLSHSWISTGTELSYLRGERLLGDTAWQEGDPSPFPAVRGYQKVGRVEWTGTNVTDVKPGQAVFATLSRVEGMCRDIGGHISPSVVPRSEVWPLPEHLDPVAFSGLVLTQVGYNCGSRPPVGIGEVAVVIGDGLVGHWAAQTLAWRGATVVLLGHHPDRLARFRPGPPHVALDTTTTAAAAWLDERFPEGVAVIVDTVGSIRAVEEIAPLLRRFGHIVSAGFYGSDDRLALQPLRPREIGIDVVSGWDRDRMDATLELVARGVLETEPLITHRFPVEQAPEAWRMIDNYIEPYLGVVLDWDESEGTR